MPSPAATRFWRKKAVLFGMETTYATDPTLSGTTDWIEARNVTFTPYEADTVDRGVVQPWLGNGGKLVGSTRYKLEFEVALTASGTLGTAPKIAKLLRACGFAEVVTASTKVEYTLVSSAFESAACYIYIDGVLHKLLGTRGNCSFTLDAKGVPLVKFSLTALYAAPTDTATPAITRTGWNVEEAVNSANTLVCTVNAVNSFATKFALDLGNQVAHEEYIGNYQCVSITDRQSSASITMLSELLATFNPYTLAQANTACPVQIVHGSVAGKKIQIDLKTKITGIKHEDLNGKVGYSLDLTPEPSTGNDEIKLTFI